MKDVPEGPIAGIEVTKDKFGLKKGSPRILVIGDNPLIESMEAAGERPVVASERCLEEMRIGIKECK